MSLPPSNASNWQTPSNVHGSRWSGFLMSKLNYDSPSHRRKAKCSYCNEIFNDARPHRLFMHLKDRCQKIPPDKKSKYIQEVLQDSRTSDSEEVSTSGTSTSLSTPLSRASSIIRKQSHGDTPSTASYFRCMSNDRTQELHELILKALIVSNVSFRFLDNKYFQDYQRALVRSPYKLPTRDSICNNVLPLLHAKREAMILEQVINTQGMTLSIDGWTDVSGCSLYALLLLKGQHIKQFIDILDLNLKRHTAENLYEAVKNCFDRKQISFRNISAVVTDSPSVMIKFQKLLTNDNPHVVRTHCVLHSFNLIAKHFTSHPAMTSIVKGNKTLVNYFTTSSYWSEYLKQWAKEENITHGLSTLCESRWYSLSKVCMSVQSHEEGFKKCLSTFRNPTIDTPSIPATVISVIEDRDHFTSNDALVSLLKPVVDAISRLEHQHTELSDIWKEFSNVYFSLISTTVYDCFTSVKNHCLKVIHQRAQDFQADIYIISFSLHLSFHNVAVSLKHSLKDITVMILVLDRDWQYSKEDAAILIPQIKQYYSQHEPFGQKCKGVFPSKAIDYWLGLPDTAQCLPLKTLALNICELVPHAAGVEGLFSVMAAIKTKYRNPMLPTTLKMISQIKLHLIQENPQKTLTQPKKNKNIEPADYDVMCGHDFFNSPIDLEEFEEGIFSYANMDVISRQDAFMETLFDFRSWDEANQQIIVGAVPIEDRAISVVQRTMIWDPYNMI
ncbi:hypothetical protein O181_099935 [Austropuccinia psidii MF-1]|uniref:DUF659 domain-containing protein n=1 Tax=Austropuccinia psidii MF-1 TaxID=1389203 RepID=A0A9Q3JBT5_9BASI|nr:hypothetical protein [Austropuccinia psidii MF-1]